MSSSRRLGVMRPGDGFVVAGAGFEAAVEDADEPVGELAQGGVVVGAAGAELVVVGAGARGGSQGTKCLLVEGIGEAVVAHEPSKDDLFLAGLLGHRRGAGVVLAGPRGAIAAGVVAELPQHPSAEHAA